MVKLFKKFFSLDSVFLASAAIGFIFAAFETVVYTISYPESVFSEIYILIRGILGVILYLSYKKHCKNVMKPIMGALLMDNLVVSLSWCANMNYSPLDTAMVIINLVFSVVLFVTHLFINTSRQSKPAAVFINQISLIILLIVNVVILCEFIGFYDGLLQFAYFANIIGYFGLIFTIICVETKMDAYKIKREAEGWTPEKGYQNK